MTRALRPRSRILHRGARTDVDSSRNRRLRRGSTCCSTSLRRSLSRLAPRALPRGSLLPHGRPIGTHPMCNLQRSTARSSSSLSAPRPVEEGVSCRGRPQHKGADPRRRSAKTAPATRPRLVCDSVRATSSGRSGSTARLNVLSLWPAGGWKKECRVVMFRRRPRHSATPSIRNDPVRATQGPHALDRLARRGRP